MREIEVGDLVEFTYEPEWGNPTRARVRSINKDGSLNCVDVKSGHEYQGVPVGLCDYVQPDTVK